jgi:RNA polymerase sigma-70 factor (ECF subfamily)
VSIDTIDALPPPTVGSLPPLDLTALYQELGPRLRGLIRNTIHDPALVDDLLQETFLRAHRAIDRFDTELPVWPWISTIAKRLCWDVLRSGQRASVHALFVEVVDGQATGSLGAPEESCTVQENRAFVVSTLEALPERQRRLLVMHYLEGMPYAEIAAHEGITLDALKGALRRARNAFRDLYVRNPHTPTLD